MGKRAKRAYMDEARKMGWKGKSYKKAKKFDRKLTRQAKNANKTQG